MEKKWWQDKVAYQIYPKSFYDSDNDGIGDISGIIEKLDYLKELGIDIIWISPCYKSPLADQGYDISDYYSIDERFGTMEDMECLIAEAKKRDMHIVMDLVVNHCSDEHEWFKKACADPDGKYGKFFYLRDKSDKLPTNLRSYFGGSVWEDMPGTNKQYLHVFHKKQPDLNWENPELREEIYKMINWWLDKGISGFRIDAIINIKKALPFRNYEADRDDGLSSMSNMLADANGIGEFLSEMRDKTFSKYDAFTVGEVFNAKEDEIKDFIGDNGYFSTMFDFSETIFGASTKGWYDRTPITPEDYKRCCFATQRQIGDIGFISNIIENHDQARGVSRYIPATECTEAGKKMLAGLYMMLKGMPFIYQGQEIGMENVPFATIDEIDDISTKDEYKVALKAGLTDKDAFNAILLYSRDNARTPMQWSDRENAGFTKGKPWLRIHPDFSRINVETETKDADSCLNFYKKLIRIRKSEEYKETLVYGQFKAQYEEYENIMAYRRVGDRNILVVGNYKMTEDSLPLAQTVKKVIIDNYANGINGFTSSVEDVMSEDGSKLILKPYHFLMLETE